MRDFKTAQVRASKISADFLHRLCTKHSDCTPSEAVMAMAMLVKEFDAMRIEGGTKNGAPSRTLQDLMIAMLGGIQAVDWSPLDAMQSAEEAPDVLLGGDDTTKGLDGYGI